MTVKKRHEAPPPEPGRQKDEPHRTQGTGTGAASALEKMKAEHALRHKRQHGQRGADSHDDKTLDCGPGPQ